MGIRTSSSRALLGPMLAAVFAVATPAAAGNWARSLGGAGLYYQSLNVRLLAGYRYLDSAWAPTDTQLQFGLDADYTAEGWPWGLQLCGTLWYAHDSEPVGLAEFTMTTWELQAGLRKTWGSDRGFQPYLAAGGTYASTTAELDGVGSASGSNSDSGFGWWVGTGGYWTLGRAFQLGIDLRYDDTRVGGGSESNVGGIQASILFGYAWREL